MVPPWSSHPCLLVKAFLSGLYLGWGIPGLKASFSVLLDTWTTWVEKHELCKSRVRSCLYLTFWYLVIVDCCALILIILIVILILGTPLNFSPRVKASLTSPQFQSWADLRNVVDACCLHAWCLVPKDPLRLSRLKPVRETSGPQSSCLCPQDLMGAFCFIFK